MRLLSLIFVALTTSTLANNIKHDEYEYTTQGMQGLKLFCDTEEKLDFVKNYVTEVGFDFVKLTRSTNIPVEVLVAAHQLQSFKNTLAEKEIHYEIGIHNVYTVAEEESRILKKLKKRKQDILDTYPTYNEIVDYLKALATVRKQSVEYFSLGNSSEGREIAGVKISTGGIDKPAVFIDAGIHAREWIAPTTALYAIQKLALSSNYDNLLKKVDFYIVPVLNPDGYEFTHKPGSRMWRKTRSNNTMSSCKGVDANRNFDYKWMEIGASQNPCTDTYAGPKPFSEPETTALAKFLSAKRNIIKVYLTLHSYGNYMLHPWGFAKTVPSNEPTLRKVAEKAAIALYKLRSTPYTIGGSAIVLYPAAGGSDDWALALGEVELSYTIELPSARFGFNPPTSEIKPVGQETFEAIKVFAEFASEQKVGSGRRYISIKT